MSLAEVISIRAVKSTETNSPDLFNVNLGSWEFSSNHTKHLLELIVINLQDGEHDISQMIYLEPRSPFHPCSHHNHQPIPTDDPLNLFLSY